MARQVVVAAALLLLATSAALPAWAGDREDCNISATLKNEPARAVAACRRLADQGDAFAQLNLGVMYRDGHGVPQDYAEAARWFRKSADQDSADRGLAFAQLNLGSLYESGQGVPHDYVQAYMWMYLAAAHLPIPQLTLERDALAAKMTPTQIEQAKALAAAWKPKTQETAATPAPAPAGDHEDCPPRLFAGGKLLSNIDPAKALAACRRLADLGNAVAQDKLGAMYAHGVGVAQDYAEAAKWFRKAAEQGYAEAQSNLGASYGFGQGVPRDYAEALKWFRMAADQGSASAQSNIGAMYALGQGVRQDYAEALMWTRKAADQGYAMAQYNLGEMYVGGQGVAQDYAEAAKWYRRAAEQDLDYAQTNLGMMYYQGQGVPQDYAEALRWWQKAAERGYDQGQNDLGLLYFFGHGVPQDYVQAYMWWSLAAAQGDAAAARNRDKVAAKMTAAQIDQAKALAVARKPNTRETAAASAPAQADDHEDCRPDISFSTEAAEARLLATCRRLADQGNAVAQYTLGMMTQDYAERARWYRKAADQGYARAQLTLGMAYVSGQGVPQDHVQAYMWFSLAGDRGLSGGSLFRDGVAAGRVGKGSERTPMTPAQIAQAKALAAAWKPTTGQ